MVHLVLRHTNTNIKHLFSLYVLYSLVKLIFHFIPQHVIKHACSKKEEQGGRTKNIFKNEEQIFTKFEESRILLKFSLEDLHQIQTSNPNQASRCFSFLHSWNPKLF